MSAKKLETGIRLLNAIVDLGEEAIQADDRDAMDMIYDYVEGLNNSIADRATAKEVFSVDDETYNRIIEETKDTGNRVTRFAVEVLKRNVVKAN